VNIAIVLLNWNGEKLLRRFLPTLVTNSLKAKIYVIDNGSSDNSVKYIKNNFQNIKCIVLKKNYGFAEGYNLGLKNINADLFCLINSDIEVTKNWLEPVIRLFKSDTDISIAQPKILNYNKKNFFEYSGAAGGYIDSYGYAFCRGRIFSTLERDQNQYNDKKRIFWASGACIFIRSKLWKNLNGFDKDLFAHFEEIDFCWRAFNRGHKNYYIPNSKVFHIGAASLKVSYFKWYLNFRNSLIVMLKNLPEKDLFKILATRLFLDIIAALRFLFKGKLKIFLAIFKSHIYFYKNYKKHYKKRENKITENQYWKVRSIVWEYFIKKNKIFSSLSQYSNNI
tara:strand:- start:5093 stop:6103 length:1011 start_codon:yes stop_codon:yes gene_type:complete